MEEEENGSPPPSDVLEDSAQEGQMRNPLKRVCETVHTLGLSLTHMQRASTMSANSFNSN